MESTPPQRTPWHPLTLLSALALWLATAGNLPLWLALWRLPESQAASASLSLLGLMLALAAFTLGFLSLLVWPRWLKAAGVLLLAVSALAAYFMQSYGVVIDASMIANVFNTNPREALDLASWPLLAALALGWAAPAVWLLRQPVARIAPWRLMGQQLGAALLALLLAVLLLWATFQDLASLMRNHKSLRYMINPFNTVYALTRHSLGQAARAQQPLQAIGLDARQTVLTGDVQTAPLIVVVVGETARAANFGLGGYARDTTPKLRQVQAQGDLVYFSQVSSCGTNTETSVPCMFSHLGREAYVQSEARYENLLDVLQRAGLAVLWLDNQAGCKGVCDRVPHLELSSLQAQLACPDGECLDEALLRVLPQQLAQLDPARRARGTVVVLHQMGSHGPAYARRSPPEFKAFQPECGSAMLQDCPPQHIVNAYDNSLRYTDHVLAQTIQWLQTEAAGHPTALLYASDHGESLGEKGLYLHGMPYRLAPREQTHVPMLLWRSEVMQKQRGWAPGCLQAQADKPWSHDQIFHTVLNLAGVHTALARPEQDLLSACGPVTAGAGAGDGSAQPPAPKS